MKNIPCTTKAVSQACCASCGLKQAPGSIQTICNSHAEQVPGRIMLSALQQVVPLWQHVLLCTSPGQAHTCPCVAIARTVEASQPFLMSHTHPPAPLPHPTSGPVARQLGSPRRNSLACQARCAPSSQTWTPLSSSCSGHRCRHSRRHRQHSCHRRRSGCRGGRRPLLRTSRRRGRRRRRTSHGARPPVAASAHCQPAPEERAPVEQAQCR